MKSFNLKSTSIIVLFFHYFLPALLAMLAMSTYAIVDGFFVAHALDSNAVAALGITWPIFPILVAFELLFSIGGASMVSYYLGRNEEQKARKIFSSIVYFVLLCGSVISIVLVCYTREITLLLGASEQIEQLVIDYLLVIFAGSSLMFLHPILDIFVVNDKRPVLAMTSMFIAAIGNMIFNYLLLFVFDFGIQASAFSTILGNILAIIVLLWHFLSKKGKLFFVRAFDLTSVFNAMKNGLPSSIAELSAGGMMWIYNLVLMSKMGERGIIIYTVTMYGGILFFTILLAIAQGIQPISSFNYGAQCLKRVRQVYQFGIVFSLCVSMSLYAIFYLWGEEFAKMFLGSQYQNIKDLSLIQEIAQVIKIWFIAYLALGINMVSSIFLQSIQRPWGALLITLSYTIILTPLFLFIFQDSFHGNGVWIAYPLASVLSILITICVLIFEFKKGVLYDERKNPII